jgi:hypothetical protein
LYGALIGGVAHDGDLGHAEGGRPRLRTGEAHEVTKLLGRIPPGPAAGPTGTSARSLTSVSTSSQRSPVPTSAPSRVAHRIDDIGEVAQGHTRTFGSLDDQVTDRRSVGAALVTIEVRLEGDTAPPSV